MVYVALGDAIVRLSTPDETAHSLSWCLKSGTAMLADGALRAVAMQRLVLDAATIDHLLDFLDPLDAHNGLRFWAAAAAAGWPGPRVTEFLRGCAAGPRADVAHAAASSLQGKYQAYSPLRTARETDRGSNSPVNRSRSPVRGHPSTSRRQRAHRSLDSNV